ncbi:MAG: dehydrogenase, partial [Verrucomicrobiaceae bacterium]
MKSRLFLSAARVALLLSVPPAGKAQSPAAPLAPVPPEIFTLSDPGLEVTVWAQSPLLRNPTNIDIDSDGCIWVAEGVNYRMHFNRQPEGDRIMVLQDTDGDGKADKSWPFVQEKFLRAPLGVAVIGNKVVVSMAPDLVVYTDLDGDKRFDSAKGDTREVLLTGFFGRNHDHSLHSVTAGPDGKWYFSAGNCGAEFTDKSGKTFRIGSKQNVSWWPKDPDRPDGDPNKVAGLKSDDDRVYVGGFIARMNPDGTHVEILAHNLRNSYENCVTSFGDIFASDNDDQPACRVFGVLEGGNYGFASANGSRAWQADRRPGQDVKTATWRQEDPGVAPAGDIYGGGAPTGCVFYENGALGARHEGTLLVCEAALNTIFGYKPQPHGAGWKLERFSFLTTNQDGKIIGTDSTGGNRTAKADDTKTLFRPSDIAVGPDGALYISDWLDPRTGGHADMDDSVSGTIYR